MTKDDALADVKRYAADARLLNAERDNAIVNAGFQTSLDDFRSRYAKDDNEWWRLSSGEMQNLFDEACERLDALTAIESPRGGHCRVFHKWDGWTTSGSVFYEYAKWLGGGTAPAQERMCQRCGLMQTRTVNG